MSYEQDCNDYAVHGNPERDHWDYEEGARYDRWDGHRGEDDYAAEREYEDRCYDRDCDNRIALIETMTDEDYIDSRDVEELK